MERLCPCGAKAASWVKAWTGVRYYQEFCTNCKRKRLGRFGRTDARRNVKESCEACGHRPVTPELLEVDHILPRSRGGDNSPENLQTLCANCHKIKTLLDRKPDHEMRALLLADGLLLVSSPGVLAATAQA